MERNGILYFVTGAVLGVVLGFIICAVSPYTSRYELVVSQDGSTVHRIDEWSGRVWQKNVRTETGPDGNLVSILYWEAIDLKRSDATQAAREIREKTELEKEFRMEEREEQERADMELRQKRLNDVYIICQDDEDCISQKCEAGYKGSEDSEWTDYCVSFLREYVFDTVIERCRGEERCIKTYCINKHNNTYPPVSNCVRDINTHMANKQGDELPAQADPEEETSEESGENL